MLDGGSPPTSLRESPRTEGGVGGAVVRARIFDRHTARSQPWS